MKHFDLEDPTHYVFNEVEEVIHLHFDLCHGFGEGIEAVMGKTQRWMDSKEAIWDHVAWTWIKHEEARNQAIQSRTEQILAVEIKQVIQQREIEQERLYNHLLPSYIKELCNQNEHVKDLVKIFSDPISFTQYITYARSCETVRYQRGP